MMLVPKKIIDVMYFSGKEIIKFGASIFRAGKTTTKRFIIEYNANSNISVRYEKEENRIVCMNIMCQMALTMP